MEPKCSVSLAKNGPMVIIRADSIGELTSALEALKQSPVPTLVDGLHDQMFPTTMPSF